MSITAKSEWYIYIKALRYKFIVHKAAWSLTTRYRETEVQRDIGLVLSDCSGIWQATL